MLVTLKLMSFSFERDKIKSSSVGLRLELKFADFSGLSKPEQGFLWKELAQRGEVHEHVHQVAVSFSQFVLSCTETRNGLQAADTRVTADTHVHVPCQLAVHSEEDISDSQVRFRSHLFSGSELLVSDASPLHPPSLRTYFILWCLVRTYRHTMLTTQHAESILSASCKSVSWQRSKV